MSLIPCTQNCTYQNDGVCMLSSAGSSNGKTAPNDLCLDFTPRISDQYSNRLPDIVNPDQL